MVPDAFKIANTAYSLLTPGSRRPGQEFSCLSILFCFKIFKLIKTKLSEKSNALIWLSKSALYELVHGC